MGKLLNILFIITSIVVFALLCKSLFLSTYPDFAVYYEAGKVAIQHGNIYGKLHGTSDQFLYGPLAVVLILPFTILSLSFAAKVWTVISLACLLCSFVLSLKIIKISVLDWKVGMLFTFTCLYFPIKFTLGMGQINLLILTALLFVIWKFLQRKEYLTGSVLGIIYMIKAFPALLILYFVFKGNTKIVVACMIAVVSIVVLEMIFFSSSFITYYFHIFPALFHASPDAYYNQALSGLLNRAGVPNKFNQLLKICISLLLVTTTIFLCIRVNVRKKSKSIFVELLLISLFIVTSLLINSFSWQHHFVFLLPVYIWLFYCIDSLKKQKIGQFIVLGVSYILTAGNLAHPELFNVLVQSHVFLGTFLLYLQISYILLRYGK